MGYSYNTIPTTPLKQPNFLFTRHHSQSKTTLPKPSNSPYSRQRLGIVSTMAKLNTPGTPKRGRGRPPKNQILISQLQKAASSPAPQASATPVRGGPSRTRSSLGSEAIPVATTPVASKSPARQGKKLHWTQKIKQELGLEGTPVATKSPGRPHKKLHWTQKLKQDLEQSRAENETKE